MTNAKRIKIGPFVVRPHVRDGKPSGVWQLDVPARYSPNGKRSRHSLETRREAEELATKLSRQLEIKAHIAGQPAPPAGITFSEVAAEWTSEQVEAVQAGLKRRSSLETNAFQLKALLPIFGRVDTGQIAAPLVVEYQKTRRAAGKTPETINSETATLKQILRWAVTKGLCSALPQVRKVPIRHKRVELPTPHEIALVIKHLPKQQALLAELLAETGCRPAEAYGLVWRDIDFDRAIVRIRPSEERGLKTPESERSVHISSAFAKKLKASRADGDYVFGGRNGGSVTTFRKALKSAVERAGLARGEEPLVVTAKTFRKAHATWQVSMGTPESHLQSRMGHVPGSRVTKQYYISPSFEADKKAIIQLPKTRRPRHRARSAS